MLSCEQNLNPLVVDLLKTEWEEEKINLAMAHQLRIEYKKFEEQTKKRNEKIKKHNFFCWIRDTLIGAGAGIVTTGLIATAILLLGLAVPPLGILLSAGGGIVLTFSGLASALGALIRYIDQNEFEKNKNQMTIADSEQDTDFTTSNESSSHSFSSPSLIYKILNLTPPASKTEVYIPSDSDQDMNKIVQSFTSSPFYSEEEYSIEFNPYLLGRM